MEHSVILLLSQMTSMGPWGKRHLAPAHVPKLHLPCMRTYRLTNENIKGVGGSELISKYDFYP